MGYWRSSCSPYDVQAQQGGRFTFDTVKERYKSTIPLRGKRKDQNIRPLNRRDRTWERIIEVNENEYYVSYDCYSHRKIHNRAITWKMVDDMEYMTIHTPKSVWGNQPTMYLHPRTLSSASIYWFYDFNMPNEFSMVNHYANKYVKYQDKCYTIERGDIVFIRKQGNRDWLLMQAHKEFKHHIDRAKAKELREIIKPFMQYYDLMSDIVEDQWHYGNPISRAVNDGEHGNVTPEQAVTLFKPLTDGSVPDGWLTLVESYKHRITRSYYYGNKPTPQEERARLPKAIEHDLFGIVKPVTAIEIPLGQVCIDRYKKWYR